MTDPGYLAAARRIVEKYRRENGIEPWAWPEGIAGTRSKGRGIIPEVALRQPAKRDEIGIVDGKEIEIAVRIMPLAKCPQKIALRK